jgi:hypothetical protein
MLLFFNCHLLPSVLYGLSCAPIILLLSVQVLTRISDRHAFPTWIRISHPDFDFGFLTRISGFPTRISGFPTRISEPGFLTRISDLDFPNPDFWPGFPTCIWPGFLTRFFQPGFLTRISHPDSRLGFLTRISDPDFWHPDFRPGFPTQISDSYYDLDFRPGFLTRISGFTTRISEPGFLIEQKLDCQRKLCNHCHNYGSTWYCISDSMSLLCIFSNIATIAGTW